MSWYLWVNDMINHLKIFEIRKSRSKLIETKKLFRVLSFWLKQRFVSIKLSMWIKVSVLWWRMQICAKYLKSKSLQLIKKLICNQLAKNAKRWRKWWNKQTIENLLFQNLIRNLKCKESKIRTFECNENININFEFLQHQIDYTMKRTIWSC